MRSSSIPFFIFFLLNLFVGIPTVRGQVDQLLPSPQKVSLRDGQILIKTDISQLDSVAGLLKFDLSSSGKVSYLNDQLRINLVDSLLDVELPSDEAYKMEISSNGIVIDAVSSKGAFYAMQTLKQLGVKKPDGHMLFQFATLLDWPAFPIRGFMHDVGRGFIPAEELKEQIGMLSGYKINFFHWHLTEDIAWRLESDVFPQLVSSSNQERFPGNYYSKEEVRDLLEYARAKHVTVIPEIDIPGHSDAFRRALGVDMQTDKGKEALKKLLKEAAELFEGAPYFHLGTDEVIFTDPNFVPEMVSFVRDLGFKVVSWNPGWDYKEGEIDLLQLWSYRGARKGAIPVIDSRFHYINHFDPFADLISLYRSNVLGEDFSDGVVKGAVLAVWNDRALADSETILKENNFYPLMLAFSERLWIGGGDGYFTDIGVKFPTESDQVGNWLEFENRLLSHKNQFFKEHEFPYYRQSDLVWNLVSPQPNLGNLDSVFQIESKLLLGLELEENTKKLIPARGGTVYLRHVWGELVPGYIEAPRPNSTGYAYTYVYSPKDQTIETWISFQDYSRSEKDLAPPQGEWDYKRSRLWINSMEIPAPVWENVHQILDSEVPLSNENVQSRPPTDIFLKKGWNKIVMRLPVGEFTIPEVRLVKWMFTFVPVNGEGLVFSNEITDR